MKIESTFKVKKGLAEMLKGGVIMDVVNAEQAVIAEKSGAVAALVNNEQKDLSYLLNESCRVELIREDSNEGLYIMRHSCAHLLAQAVTELFPNAKPTIGPPIDDGFYYDFFMDPINEDDLRRIEKLMKK